MDVSPAKRSYFTCANVWWKLLFHSTIFLQTVIFTGFARDFKLHSHSIFLVLHHFYTISFDFGVMLIFFTPNYTSDLNLHHCWYSIWQVHF